MFEQKFVAAVTLLGVAHAGVLAHGPETASIHGGLDAARKGEFAGKAKVFDRVKTGGFEIGAGVDGFGASICGHGVTEKDIFSAAFVLTTVEMAGRLLVCFHPSLHSEWAPNVAAGEEKSR